MEAKFNFTNNLNKRTCINPPPGLHTVGSSWDPIMDQLGPKLIDFNSCVERKTAKDGNVIYDVPDPVNYRPDPSASQSSLAQTYRSVNEYRDNREAKRTGGTSFDLGGMSIVLASFW